MKDKVRFATGPLVVILIAIMAPLITLGQPTDAPNIIFILVDDHRWDALSTLGHPVVKTPNLDRLCHVGVRFENAFVTTSL